MSDALKFIFELVDKMSGPSRAIEKQMRAVDDSIRKTDSALKQSLIDKMVPGLKKTRAELGMQKDALLESGKAATEHADRMSSYRDGMNSVAVGALAVGGAIMAGGVAFAKSAIDVASFAEDNKAALKIVTGSQEEANGILKDMIGLAAHLPITDQLAMGAATRFMLSGFKRGELSNMVTAMSDVQSMNPGRGIDAMNDFANIMTRVKAAGVSELDFHFLSKEVHINPDAIRKQLEALGYQVKTVQDLKRSITAGSINSDDFIQAVNRAIGAMAGGNLGTMSLEKSKTLSGLMSTLEGRKYALMIDLDTSPGYQTLRDFVKNLTEITDPASAIGKDISASIGSTFNDIMGEAFGQFTGPGGAAKLADVVKTDILPAFRDLATVFTSLLSTTMMIVSGWAEIIRYIHYDSGQKAMQTSLKSKSLSELVTDAAGGKLDIYPRDAVLEAAKTAGIKAGVGPDVGFTRVGMALAKSGTAAGADIARTSYPYLGLGSQNYAGINDHDARMPWAQDWDPALDANESAAIAARAMTERQGFPSVPTSAPGVTMASLSAPITIQIDARGATKEDASAIAEALDSHMPSTMTRLFEQLATQFGQ